MCREMSASKSPHAAGSGHVSGLRTTTILASERSQTDNISAASGSEVACRGFCRAPVWSGFFFQIIGSTPVGLSQACRRRKFLYGAKRSWSFGFEASNCKFPYECLRVLGRSALATWKKLKLDGRGVQIVLGDDYSFDTVLRHLYVARTQSWMSKDELLVKANEMNLRVFRPPEEKAEALELAREHCDFCRAFLILTRSRSPRWPPSYNQSGGGRSSGLIDATGSVQELALKSGLFPASITSYRFTSGLSKCPLGATSGHRSAELVDKREVVKGVELRLD